MVAITTTRATNVMVFGVPNTLRMTSIFGKLNAGPASSNAKAGPFPMPAPSNPCKIGTSVSVAKYIKAPTTEANRLAHNELPPTRLLTHCEGISPSEPGLPNSSPATNTPANKSGMICLAKSQVDRNQLSVSPRVEVIRTTKAMTPAEKAISG